MFPCVGGGEVVGQDVVDDLLVERREVVPVILEVERLVEACEGAWRFDDDKVVDLIAERVEANLEPVELVVHEEEVVDFAFASQGIVGLPEIRRAKLGGSGLGDVGRGLVVD